MSGAAPFPIDPVRTGIVIAYRNDKLIADGVMPRRDVEGELFKWFEYDKAERLTHVDTEISRKGSTKEVEFDAVEKESSTSDFGLGDTIPQSDMDKATESYDPLDHAAEALTDLVLLDREIRVARTVFDPKNHAHGKPLAAAEKFSNRDADLLPFLLEQLDKPLMRPNTLTIGRAEWTQMRTNRSLVAAAHGNSGDKGVITVEKLKELLEIDFVFIGEARLNIARKGKEPEVKRVWGGHAAFTYQAPNVEIPAGTMTWGATAQYGDRFFASWHDRDVGLKGGWRVRVGEQLKELVIAKECGLLLQNVI
ncbi:TPA: phage capsid protein [Pseudomonas aeruginosa]|uniref:phage capsid protein n=1 Tax=Pseudomonas aeruginosa TaxID=287 RepID=UPI000F893CD2|nr:phage capsid protein [Pseudomonas aeruginosa]RUI11465.1 phage capsid protein [Pseudomonas aeruginosa]